MALTVVFHATSGFAAPEDPSRYSVTVSVADQRTYVYRDGRLLRSMLCSTGTPGTDDATPLGDFVINESGQKRGDWFYSAEYGQGARYWVGFIGGTYLFHSVPMDGNRQIIPHEAAKLGRPASHGCVRLSLEDAYWFYTTVPDRTVLHIIADPHRESAASVGTLSPGVTKSGVPEWLASNMQSYRQSYTLSCEIALIRLSLALMGIRDLTEEDILATIPRGGKDPERAFVCDDIRGGRRNADGSIHWDNYGAHPPVIVAEISRRLADAGVAGRYAVREMRADDATLRSLVAGDRHFLGAIVWLVGHPERWGTRPAVNERGMVLGEHVRFLEPVLSADGWFRLWDPETAKLVISREAGAARDLFGNRVVAIFAAQ